MSDFDNPWKEALDSMFERFMAFYFPAIHKEIDWTRDIQPKEQELRQVLRDAEQGRRVVDKLVVVYTKSGTPLWILIHIEIQCQYEAGFSRRMYTCHYRLFDLYEVHPVSLVVFGDDRPKWRPAEYRHEYLGCDLFFRFPTVKLLDYQDRHAELEQSPNPFAVLTLAHLAALGTRDEPSARFNRKSEIIRGLYDRGLSAEHVVKLFHVIDWMLDLPPDLDRIFWDECLRLDKEKHMPYMSSFERRAAERGREEARVALRRAIRAILARFGDAGARLADQLVASNSLDSLQSALEAASSASSVSEVEQLIISSNIADSTTDESSESPH